MQFIRRMAKGLRRSRVQVKSDGTVARSLRSLRPHQSLRFLLPLLRPALAGKQRLHLQPSDQKEKVMIIVSDFELSLIEGLIMLAMLSPLGMFGLAAVALYAMTGRVRAQPERFSPEQYEVAAA